jgi:transglutaminase-like putative cysteine protease
MSKKTKILTASLLDAIAIVIGIYGIIFSIVTAYDIKLDASTVIWVLLVSSLCFSLIFHIEKFKKTAYISVSVICAVMFALNAERIMNGFLKFIHLITSKLSMFSSSIPVTKDVTLSTFSVFRANTAFFAFFAVLLALLLALSIIKARSVWLASVISICCFALSLVFIKNVPDDLPVFAYIVFLLSIILTCFIRKSSSRRASYMLSLFLPVTLVFVITINAIFPESTYNRTSIANTMYQFFAQRLPLTVKHGGNNSGSIYVEGSGDVTSSISGAYSGTASSKMPGSKAAYEKIDLNDASPTRTGKTVLRINASKKGKLLLRGFSLGKYTGSSWEQYPNTVQKVFYMFYEMPPAAVSASANIFVTPLSLTTYFAMAAYNAEPYSVQINETEEGGKLIFTPYYPLFNATQGFVFGNDSYLLNKSNNPNEKAAYNIYAYSYDDVAKIWGNIDAEKRNTSGFETVENAEKNFRNKVSKYYTQIDDATSAFLEEYTKEQNFQQITDRKALVDAVAQFVKKSAEYNANTPVTPQGKDYLQYFLTESKQGYCMHFATEATLIFRMLGVPARYVTGYSINVSEENVGKWIDASDRNAHAWVEVYFDGIGWVPVDVTPSVYQNPGTTSNSSSSSTSAPSTSSHTRSVPSATSSESTGSEEESQVSSDSSVEPVTSPSNGIRIPVWIYPVVLMIAALLFIYFRRKELSDKRRKCFAQQNTNKAVIFAWNYIEKLKVYGVSPDKSIYSTAQKAVFSKHTLSEEERQMVVGFAQEKAKELDKNLGFFKKIIFRFIKGLY